MVERDREREREREEGSEMLFLVARYKLSGAVAAVSLMGLAKCGSAPHVFLLAPPFTY